jgi:hypothetical protein
MLLESARCSATLFLLSGATSLVALLVLCRPATRRHHPAARSVLRFIEDNWELGRIGDQSFDAKAGSLENLFDFSHGRNANRLFLDPRSGQPSHNRR